MAAGTLYTYPDNFRAFKALIAAEYSGKKVNVDSAFKFGETNQSAAFLSKFPLGKTAPQPIRQKYRLYWPSALTSAYKHVKEDGKSVLRASRIFKVPENTLRDRVLGKVPAFESSNGDKIFESNAIALYVGNEELNGKTQADAAKVQQWVNFGSNEILPASCTWVFPCLGITQFNKQETENAKSQMKKALGVLDRVLKTKTYLVGERVSQADIAVCCDLLLAFQYVLEPSFRSPYVNVNRWFNTLINQPNVKKVIGNFKLCEKMAVFDGKKYAELHGVDKKKKEKENKQAQQKKEPPKKKETPKKEAEDDMDDMPKEEKSKDPFAKFPKSDFDMDAFKRCYSNNDADVSVPYFWEKFDKENYSVWYCTYKDLDYLKTQKVFMACNLVGGAGERSRTIMVLLSKAFTFLGVKMPDVSVSYFWEKFDKENYSVWYCTYKDLDYLKTQKVFMACNLVGGMYQRLDKMRKNSFASMALFGKDNDLQIAGVWFWKGHELAFTLSEDWSIDYESYDWKKLDPDNADHKKMINEYFAWEGDFADMAPRKLIPDQGKIYK